MRLSKKYEQELKKKELIDEILKRYKSFKPKEDLITEYNYQLQKLPIKELQMILDDPFQTKPKKGMISRLASLNKKKAILINLVHSNGTIGHYVISKYSRTFTLKKKTYVLNPSLQYKDINYKMQSYWFIEDVPLPIRANVLKNKEQLVVDSQALKDVIKMEYVELLTKVAKVKDLLKITVVLSAVASIGIVVVIVMCAKGFGFVG
jgi:hypothetical protein